MTEFIAVGYRGRSYPNGVESKVKEIPSHFGVKDIDCDGRYSLHTEYSFIKRDLSKLHDKYPVLESSQKRGIPKLWSDDEWAKEFGEFVIDKVSDNPDPDVIEIHPPFRDYCSDFDSFFEIYLPFEDMMKERFPDTIITMENRCGSYYGGPFLMSKIGDMRECCEHIIDNGCRLKIAADYTQMFTAEGYDFSDIPIDDFIDHHSSLREYRSLISSVHLWGKRQNSKGRWIAHQCGLREMLPGDKLNRFLSTIQEFYDDGIRRYFVPEINGSEKYVQEMVSDCIYAGIRFV